MIRRSAAGRSLFAGVIILVIFAALGPACGPDGHAGTSTISTALTAATTPTVATISAGLVTSTTSPAPTVTITILYDNTAIHAGTRADWGFSCLIEGLEKTVLFDAGKDGDILLSNMEMLGIVPDDIDVVVLSHEHSDHTGGLERILARNPGVTVYYPASFSGGLVESMRAAGASLAPVDDAVSVCAGLLVTSPLGSPAESALLVDTAQGPVLVTGCAHPGIVEMATAASDLVGEPIFAVMGGFHLTSSSASQVDRIIQGLRELGVARCGPAHCTGEAATARIRAVFADGFIATGVGAISTF